MTRPRTPSEILDAAGDLLATKEARAFILDLLTSFKSEDWESGAMVKAIYHAAALAREAGA